MGLYQVNSTSNYLFLQGNGSTIGNINSNSTSEIESAAGQVAGICRILLICIASLGVFNNTLVAITIGVSKRIRTTSIGFLMVLLAVLDTTFMSTEIVMQAGGVTHHMKTELCVVFFYISHTTSCASHLVTLAVCVNRYVLVCWPLQRALITGKMFTKRLLVCILLFALIINCFIFKVRRGNGYDCRVSQEQRFVYILASFITYTILCTVIPLLAMIPMTAKVILTIRQSHYLLKRTGSARIHQNHEQRNRSEKQVTSALVAVIIAFIILRLPHLTLSMLANLELLGLHHLSLPQSEIIPAFMIAEVFAALNYIVNLYFYYFLSPVFRLEFNRHILCRVYGKKLKATFSTAGESSVGYTQKFKTNVSSGGDSSEYTMKKTNNAE